MLKILYSAAFLAALAAPAHAQSSAGPAPAQLPTRYLSIARAIDSEAAVAGLRALPSSDTPSHEWVFDVYFSTAGTVDSVTSSSKATAPPELLDSVKAVLRRSAITLPASDSLAKVVFVALTGPRAVVRAVTEEQPRLANHAAARRALGRAAEVLRNTAPDRFVAGYQHSVVVSMRVDARGVPTLLRPERSGGDPLLDAQAIRAASDFRFVPAKVEGQAVAVLVKIPVTFEF